MARVGGVIEVPHPGQERILRACARNNCVMGGRRSAKTVLGCVRAKQIMLGAGLPVGWFAPNYKRFVDGWSNLTRSLRPFIVSASDTKKRIVLVNGGSLQGWSLDGDDDPGRGSGYAAVFIDEAGLIPNLEQLIKEAIRPTLLDYADSELWLLGTPKATGRYFTRQFRLGRSGKDPRWASFSMKTIDNPYLTPDVVAEVEAARLEMEPWMFEQEYEGVPHESDAGFFGDRLIDRLLAESRAPLWRGNITVPYAERAMLDVHLAQRDARMSMVDDGVRGKLSLWVPPERPSRGRRFGIGIDLGHGLGSSNTVFSIGDVRTRQKVGRWVSAGVDPKEAARQAMQLSLWFNNATLNPEVNGAAGQTFMKALAEFDWPYVWARPNGKAGWQSTGEEKAAMLGEYRSALMGGRFGNPDADAIKEMLLYYHKPTNPNHVITEYEMNGPTDEAAVPHGDRVIADGLLNLTFLGGGPEPIPDPEPPVGSMAWHDLVKERQERAADDWGPVDERETEW